MFELNAVCESCNASVKVTPQTIRRSRIVCKDDNKILIATNFKCSVCGRVHVVQIDDGVTSKLLNELTKGIAKMAKAKKNGDILSKKETAKISKIRTDLADKRIKLLKSYQGKTFVNEDGAMFELKVSADYGRTEELKSC